MSKKIPLQPENFELETNTTQNIAVIGRRISRATLYCAIPKRVIPF